MGLRINGKPFDQHRGQSLFSTDVHVSLLMPEKYVNAMTFNAWYVRAID
jgi:hypothetical protein